MIQKKRPAKGTKGKESKGKKKEKKSALRQRNTEIISEDELNSRGGICGGTTTYLSMHLILFFDGHVVYHHSKKLIDLAEFIYQKKDLYLPKHGGYKLMEISSIITELAALKKEVQEQYEMKKEEEKKEAEKLKSKY